MKEPGSFDFLTFGALSHHVRNAGHPHCHIEVCWGIRHMCNKDHLCCLFRWFQCLLPYVCNHKRYSKWELPTEPNQLIELWDIKINTYLKRLHFEMVCYAMTDNLDKSCTSFHYSFLVLHVQLLHYKVSSMMAGNIT